MVVFSRPMETVEFINHACVKITAGEVCILSDPWLDGAVFNDGWDLLVPTPMSDDEVLRGVTHIFLSHEHPDHFSPAFLSRVSKRGWPLPKILFQRTSDGRVKKFCEAKGYEVIELESGVPFGLSTTVFVTCIKNGFYDSALHLRTEGATILNLNDCHFESRSDLEQLARRVGSVDVLMTQFSYAAWKGGEERADYRRLAAREKLETVRAQIEVFRPRFVLPFASFAVFSSVENFYMNDSVNRVHDAARVVQEADAVPVVLYPGDVWEVGTPRRNEDSLRCFGEAYDGIGARERRSPGVSVPLAMLAEEQSLYAARLRVENSAWMMKCLRALPKLGAFRSVAVRLWDLECTVLVSPLEPLVLTDSEPDCSMHSSSLSFLFRNPFGFDTLTVNGRFEATSEGFSKMTKCLALGSLNGMGLRIAPSLVMNGWAAALLLTRLRVVRRRLEQRQGPPAATP